MAVPMVTFISASGYQEYSDLSVSTYQLRNRPRITAIECVVMFRVFVTLCNPNPAFWDKCAVQCFSVHFWNDRSE